MSTQTSRMFTCPKCEKDYEVITWDSMNVQIDPDLRDKLFHNEIFKFECPHCHSIYQIVYPCLYHDPEQKIMVWLVDDKIEGDLKVNSEVPFTFGNGYKYRYCKKIMEFVEKIRIFEDGLDDRIIEMAKMFCEKQVIDSKRGTQEDIAYTVYNMSKDDAVEIVSMVKEETIRMQLNYKDFEQLFLNEEDGYDVEERHFVRVNREWMYERAQAAYNQNKQ